MPSKLNIFIHSLTHQSESTCPWQDACLLAPHGQQREVWCGIVSVGVNVVVLVVRDNNGVSSQCISVVELIHDCLHAGLQTCQRALSWSSGQQRQGNAAVSGRSLRATDVQHWSNNKNSCICAGVRQVGQVGQPCGASPQRYRTDDTWLPLVCIILLS